MCRLDQSFPERFSILETLEDRNDRLFFPNALPPQSDQPAAFKEGFLNFRPSHFDEFNELLVARISDVDMEDPRRRTEK